MDLADADMAGLYRAHWQQPARTQCGVHRGSGSAASTLFIASAPCRGAEYEAQQTAWARSVIGLCRASALQRRGLRESSSDRAWCWRTDSGKPRQSLGGPSRERVGQRTKTPAHEGGGVSQAMSIEPIQRRRRRMKAPAPRASTPIAPGAGVMLMSS